MRPAAGECFYKSKTPVAISEEATFSRYCNQLYYKRYTHAKKGV